MWSICALAPHWLSALKGRMLWGGCWTCWAKRTHPCASPVLAWLNHTKASMVRALYCTHSRTSLNSFYYMFKMLLTNLTGSGSYQQAIQDVKRFFPEGLCCPETSVMRQEQVCMSHTAHGTRFVPPTYKCLTFSVLAWFLLSDTEDVLRPFSLCGAWTELHTGPSEPGWRFGVLVLFYFHIHIIACIYIFC